MNVDASDDAEHRSQTRTVLVLLFLLMVIDYADRQVMVAAFPYLRLEWGVSDVQLGARLELRCVDRRARIGVACARAR